MSSQEFYYETDSSLIPTLASVGYLGFSALTMFSKCNRKCLKTVKQTFFMPQNNGHGQGRGEPFSNFPLILSDHHVKFGCCVSFWLGMWMKSQKFGGTGLCPLERGQAWL